MYAPQDVSDHGDGDGESWIRLQGQIINLCKLQIIAFFLQNHFNCSFSFRFAVFRCSEFHLVPALVTDFPLCVVAGSDFRSTEERHWQR